MDDGKKSIIPIISVINTTPAHINYIKKNLRTEDEAEILRFGVTVPHALWYSYKHSLVRKTALIDGIVAACWGIHGNLLGNKAFPWLMTTPEVNRVSPLKFARIYQQEVVEMLTKFNKLENYVDPSYSAAVRLLEIIGFKVEKPEKVGSGMGSKFWIIK